MFSLSAEKIDGNKLREQLANSGAGALLVFEGTVRNHNEGKKVLSLAYEAYDELANSEGTSIVEAAETRYELIGAICVHRTGQLQIGDTAVWIGVAAAHREEAYRASRYIIDKIKETLPIWKKEEYQDGDSTWVRCNEACSHEQRPHAERTLQD